LAWTSTGAPDARQVMATTYRITETGSDMSNYVIAVPDNSSVAPGARLKRETNAVYLLVDADGDFAV